MYKFSEGMRFMGFCTGCFSGWCAWQIFSNGSPDQLHLAVAAGAMSLLGFLTCFATE